MKAANLLSLSLLVVFTVGIANADQLCGTLRGEGTGFCPTPINPDRDWQYECPPPVIFYSLMDAQGNEIAVLERENPDVNQRLYDNVEKEVCVQGFVSRSATSSEYEAFQVTSIQPQ